MTDTERLNAIDNLLQRWGTIHTANGSRLVPKPSSLKIQPGWSREPIWLYLHAGTEQYRGNEKTFGGASIRDILDKLINYQQSQP